METKEERITPARYLASKLSVILQNPYHVIFFVMCTAECQFLIGGCLPKFLKCLMQYEKRIDLNMSTHDNF